MSVSASNLPSPLKSVPYCLLPAFDLPEAAALVVFPAVHFQPHLQGVKVPALCFGSLGPPEFPVTAALEATALSAVALFPATTASESMILTGHASVSPAVGRARVGQSGHTGRAAEDGPAACSCSRLLAGGAAAPTAVPELPEYFCEFSGTGELGVELAVGGGGGGVDKINVGIVDGEVPMMR
ncbi:hypothetical protein C8F04DRAFT_1289116 [Mycena alexandri]|uniref:Uncharacterized protein n=1 Tax=Mycena alexandri TaxID=1745969 RepID=A0AAD6WZ79_9AGAR|nr:hypothetical protein C8F04DRAFT_1289116 [Mycena alexandri]